ncbi:hypothetical protein CGQ12_35000, partial [Pseudomonas aeruginosa]|uniref:hypothetical protein n=1 Tax=Pseudomonas aeruginosa TaxID=287 RepID=UPI000BCB79D7
SEKAVDLGGMMRNERDWVVVFDIPRIEAEIKAKRFVTLGDSKVPVVDGLLRVVAGGGGEPAAVVHVGV